MDGLTFTTLKADGRAAKMGVLKGDVLFSVNGETVETLRDIFRVSRENDGEELTFSLKRGAEKITAKMPKADLRR